MKSTSENILADIYPFLSKSYKSILYWIMTLLKPSIFFQESRFDYITQMLETVLYTFQIEKYKYQEFIMLIFQNLIVINYNCFQTVSKLLLVFSNTYFHSNFVVS